MKIVNLDWLVDSIKDSRKHGIAQHDWTKIDKKTLRKSQPKQAPSKKRKASKGQYAEALLDHTGRFAGSATVSRDEAPAEKSVEDGGVARAEKKARTNFGRGTKTAKIDLLTNNYHIYQDGTGFRYEVTLIKVEVSKNWNERAVITLYESHLEPSTYACHFKSHNTLGLSDATPLANGSNFETAMSRFKATFEEKTGIAWDDRFEKCERRKPGRPAPATVSNNSGFITPQMVIAAGGARDPDAPPEDEKLRREFEARRLSYRTPLEEEPQGVLPPRKMGFTNKMQADAGALGDFNPNQHEMNLEDIIDTSSNEPETMPAAELQDHSPEMNAGVPPDDFERLSATGPTRTDEEAPADMEPPVGNIEDQEMTPAMGSHSDDQEMETTSESQAGDLEQTTIPLSQSMDHDMMNPNEPHLEHEQPTAVPASHIPEQEPTAAQEPLIEPPELTTVAVEPAEGNATQLEDPQISWMANTTAEDMNQIAEKEYQSAQYEPTFPEDPEVEADTESTNKHQTPQFEPTFPENPVDKVEAEMDV